MFHLLHQTLTPQVSLHRSVENWHEISMFLRENHRNRMPQVAKLAGLLS
jgi:hypothetical protein